MREWTKTRRFEVMCFQFESVTFKILLTNKNVQQNIIDEIGRGNTRLEKAISKAQTEIQKANEYQESLITQVVTGQWKVPCDQDVTKPKLELSKTL